MKRPDGNMSGSEDDRDHFGPMRDGKDLTLAVPSRARVWTLIYHIMLYNLPKWAQTCKWTADMSSVSG